MGNYATEINFIANILQREKLCSDISPLNKCCSNGMYRVEELKFNIREVPRNTRPNVELMEVLLNVSFQELQDDIPGSNYCFRITAQGLDGNVNLVKSSWHLDYDINNNQEYIHPHFHLTWGGDTMKGLGLGDVLLLPTPRISYPPLDIILGIDFVLSNFVKADIYKKIQCDSQYKNAVKNAQEKYWKPYMLSMASHWNDGLCNYSKNAKDCKYFYPTLID